VVSTPVPEVVRYSHMCRIADTPEGFVAALDAALAEATPAARRARSDAMAQETWAARVADVARTIAEIAQRKPR
jgi:hypothetical protein